MLSTAEFVLNVQLLAEAVLCLELLPAAQIERVNVDRELADQLTT